MINPLVTPGQMFGWKRKLILTMYEQNIQNEKKKDFTSAVFKLLCFLGRNIAKATPEQ